MILNRLQSCNKQIKIYGIKVWNLNTNYINFIYRQKLTWLGVDQVLFFERDW